MAMQRDDTAQEAAEETLPSFDSAVRRAPRDVSVHENLYMQVCVKRIITEVDVLENFMRSL